MLLVHGSGFQDASRGSISFTGLYWGLSDNPTYDDVSSGKTGHAESVKIDYAPKMVKYEDLLTVFSVAMTRRP